MYIIYIHSRQQNRVTTILYVHQHTAKRNRPPPQGFCYLCCFLDDCTSRFTLVLYISKLSLVTIIMYYSKFIIAMRCHFKTFRLTYYLILNLSYERIVLLITPRVNIRLVELLQYICV